MKKSQSNGVFFDDVGSSSKLNTSNDLLRDVSLKLVNKKTSSLNTLSSKIENYLRNENKFKTTDEIIAHFMPEYLEKRIYDTILLLSFNGRIMEIRKDTWILI